LGRTVGCPASPLPQVGSAEPATFPTLPSSLTVALL
jgi:hypothetical protein